jgi:hypothetical protein
MIAIPARGTEPRQRTTSRSSFPSEFEAIDDLSSHPEEMVVYKLPDDYFERYVSKSRP